MSGPNPPFSAKFDAEAGKTYYFHTKTGMVAMKLVQYTEKEEGKGTREKEFKKCKLIEAHSK